jgi:hypothetical protein|tara:strand:- start:204 stop:446 length:243 start_codon:yes stop_codon:yes gene_type:complete
MSNDGNIELNEKELEQCKEDAVAEFKEEISKNFLASMTTQLHSIILTLEGISEQLKIEKELLNSVDNMSNRVTQIYDKVV